MAPMCGQANHQRPAKPKQYIQYVSNTGCIDVFAIIAHDYHCMVSVHSPSVAMVAPSAFNSVGSSPTRVHPVPTTPLAPKVADTVSVHPPLVAAMAPSAFIAAGSSALHPATASPIWQGSLGHDVSSQARTGDLNNLGYGTTVGAIGVGALSCCTTGRSDLPSTPQSVLVIGVAGFSGGASPSTPTCNNICIGFNDLDHDSGQLCTQHACVDTFVLCFLRNDVQHNQHKVVYASTPAPVCTLWRSFDTAPSQPARTGGENQNYNRQLLPAYCNFLLVMEPVLHADRAYYTTGSGGGSEAGAHFRDCAILQDWTPEQMSSDHRACNGLVLSPRLLVSHPEFKKFDQGTVPPLSPGAAHRCFETTFAKHHTYCSSIGVRWSHSTDLPPIPTKSLTRTQSLQSLRRQICYDFEAPATLCINYIYLQHKCDYLHDYDCTRDANFDYHDQCYLCNSVHGTVYCNQLCAHSFGQLFLPLPDMHTLPADGCDIRTVSSSTPTQARRALGADFVTTQHQVVDITIENSVDNIAAAVSLHKPDYSTPVGIIKTSVLLHGKMHSRYDAGNSRDDDSDGTPLAIRPNLSCSTLLGCISLAAVNDNYSTALPSAPSCNATVSVIDYDFMTLFLVRTLTNGTAAVLPHASCTGSIAGIINSDLSDRHVTPSTFGAGYCVGNTIGYPHASYIDNKGVAFALDALSNCVRPSRTCTSQPEASTDSLGATIRIMTTQSLCLSPTDAKTFMTKVTGTEPVHSLLAVHTTPAIVLVEPTSTRTLGNCDAGAASASDFPDHYCCGNAVSGSVHCIVLPARGSEQPFVHVYAPSNCDGHAVAPPTPPPTWHTLGADFTATDPCVIASVDANCTDTSTTVTTMSSCDSVIGNICTVPSSPSCSTSVDHTSTDTDDDLYILVSFCPVIDGIAAITPMAPCPGNLVSCPCADSNYSNNYKVFVPQFLSCGVQSIRRYILQSLGSNIGSRCLLSSPTDVSTGLQAASPSLAHLPSVSHEAHLLSTLYRPFEFTVTDSKSESAFGPTQYIHQPLCGSVCDYILLPAGLCGPEKDQNCQSGYVLDHIHVSGHIHHQSQRHLRPADQPGGAICHALQLDCFTTSPWPRLDHGKPHLDPLGYLDCVGLEDKSTWLPPRLVPSNIASSWQCATRFYGQPGSWRCSRALSASTDTSAQSPNDRDPSSTPPSPPPVGDSSLRMASTALGSTPMTFSAIITNNDFDTTARTTSTSSIPTLRVTTVPSADYAFIFGYISAILGLFIANSSTIARSYPSSPSPHRPRYPPRRLRSSRRTRQTSFSPSCGYGPPHVHILPLLSNTSTLPFDYIHDHYHGRYFHPPRHTPPSTRSFLAAEGALTTADLILEQVSEAKFSIQRIARNIQRIAIRLTRSESSMESSSRPTLLIRVGQDSWLVDFTDYVSVHPTFGRVRPSTPRFRPYSFLSLSLSDYTPGPYFPDRDRCHPSGERSRNACCDHAASTTADSVQSGSKFSHNLDGQGIRIC